MSTSAIQFQDDRLRVTFDDYASEQAYDLFKRAKRLPEYQIVLDDDGLACGVTAPARFASMLGVERPATAIERLPLSSFLFDDQAAITRMALDAKRFACWSDCGLGKTVVGLEYARQVVHMTGGRVLIVTLNEIVPQWVSEAKRFFSDALPIVTLSSREEMKRWCATGRAVDAHDEQGKSLEATLVLPSIAITNYEKFNHKGDADQVVSELRQLAAIVLDESSRLKTGGGKQKWALIKSAKGIEYKLSLTATPAPNEYMEFASQAAFLEKLRAESSVADAAEQIIWTYFTRDAKTHRWTIKQHARTAFFEWMAGWSIYVRDPRRYGWRKNWSPPPEPEYFEHLLAATDDQRQLVMDFNADPRNVAESAVGTMFASELNAIAANKLSQAAKGFVYEKSAKRVRDAGDLEPNRGGGSSSEGDRISRTPVGSRLRDTGVPDASEEPLRRRRGGDEGRAGAQRSHGKRFRPIHSLKPAFVADLIVREALTGHQVLVWTVFDEETAILERLVREHPKFRKRAQGKLNVLTGGTPAGDGSGQRRSILNDFIDGKCRVLVSRADMLGYGLNFQCCTSMIFSGWSFSYEQFYQAIRRAYRDGQTQRVRVHLPFISELEGQQLDALGRKRDQHEAAIAEMEQSYNV